MLTRFLLNGVHVCVTYWVKPFQTGEYMKHDRGVHDGASCL